MLTFLDFESLIFDYFPELLGEQDEICQKHPDGFSFDYQNIHIGFVFGRQKQWEFGSGICGTYGVGDSLQAARVNECETCRLIAA